jgi:hypothetical protein
MCLECDASTIQPNPLQNCPMGPLLMITVYNGQVPGVDGFPTLAVGVLGPCGNLVDARG